MFANQLNAVAALKESVINALVSDLKKENKAYRNGEPLISDIE